MPPFDPWQVFRRRLTEPMEQLAQAVAERVVQLVLSAIDLNQVLERVDLERLVDRIDLNELVACVDVDQVVARVDVERIVERVDVDALVARVDVERVVERIDINRIVDQIDVARLVGQTDLGRVLAASTSGVVTGALDVARSHVAGLDQWLERVVSTVVHRPTGRPTHPGRPAEASCALEPGQSRHERDMSLQGRYAGPLSRLAAAAADTAASVGIFNLLLAAVAFAWRGATGHDVSFSHHPAVVDPIFALWALLYTAYPWALSGKTLGMAILGIRVVAPDGGPIGPRQAVIRALVLPVSVALAGLGLVGVVVGRERRGLHDLAAGTVVIYAWNARAAQLRAIAGAGGPGA